MYALFIFKEVCMQRRDLLKTAALFATLPAWPIGCATMPSPASTATARPKRPAVLRGAFFYPSAETVLAGKCEDHWSRAQWFTWPGNQFEPEEQQARFMRKLKELSADLNVELRIEPEPLSTNAGIQAFIESVHQSQPDGLVLFNFWNSFSGKLKPILETYKGPIILYHPVGANHQLPPELFLKAPRVQYIHSIENWDALGRGLRAIHAHHQMAHSRVLRVSGSLKQEADAVEPLFGTPIHGIPAAHFNTLFDATPVTPELRAMARAIRRGARTVTDLTEEAFLDAVRSHATVHALLERHAADAITIECLFLKHRKPCLSFAINNGGLIPCGCENDLNATMTLLLGAYLFGRGGFQHNPEFDTEENLYFASHCTCATKLRGPKGPSSPYDLRPFFHQMPKSVAVDTQWPVGERATLCKYHSGKNVLDAWRGGILGSPGCPPTGGCATRVLVKFDNVADVCGVYPGPHPVMFCGDFARQAQTFARLFGVDLKSNI
jgi:hypothetical protein